MCDQTDSVLDRGLVGVIREGLGLMDGSREDAFYLFATL